MTDRAAGTVVRLTEVVPTWRFSIPGSSPPVRMERLHLDPARQATISLVSFPQGWRRPGVGSYSCVEEFYLLEGTLELSGRTFRAGEFVHVPAGFPRFHSSSGSGARALAFFDGKPVWTPGPSTRPAGSTELIHCVPNGVVRRESEAMGGRVEVLTSPQASPCASPHAVRDVLCLATKEWVLLAGDQEPPTGLVGPFLVRTWPTGEDGS